MTGPTASPELSAAAQDEERITLRTRVVFGLSSLLGLTGSAVLADGLIDGFARRYQQDPTIDRLIPTIGNEPLQFGLAGAVVAAAVVLGVNAERVAGGVSRMMAGRR